MPFLIFESWRTEPRTGRFKCVDMLELDENGLITGLRGRPTTA